MFSLYHALLAQHARQLTPVRCAEQTITNLHRLFEDVVLDNNLAALVIGTLPPTNHRSATELARLLQLGRTARDAFFFAAYGDDLHKLLVPANEQECTFVTIESRAPQEAAERFVVIADARFSALLVSVGESGSNDLAAPGDECLWTFEPEIVYSALEYLMARATAESPTHAAAFSKAVSTSMPKATSPQFTISITTKLARLLQEQAGREAAVHRIVSAIHTAPDLDSILQTAVDELGRALDARYCAVLIGPGEARLPANAKYFIRNGAEPTVDMVMITGELNAHLTRSAEFTESCVVDEHGGTADESLLVVAPLAYQNQSMGVLVLRRDDTKRPWQETEALLLNTVAHQVAAAARNARRLTQMQQQAFVDDLTGCFNERFFRLQLEREIASAVRISQPFSLIMLDVDSLEQDNDPARRMLADVLREELRVMDTAARLDSGEFVLVLPQTDAPGALVVAERVRIHVARVEVSGVGRITASFGIAAFPVDAGSLDQLVAAVIRSFQDAQHTGRNHVRFASNPPTAEQLV